ncbi:hypothetical protein SERLA73DRAFT_101371 [Serpula lacrymans var. lacrymans S7.3]|uniref:Fungal pheromone STE3G-protein-coupled receptor n=1 Tax=Serpula lacrymans var. lacrymans (strain S7.3) TaxID=936435 RepID=F8PK55_SERL3|nr:hypothetical protein SERLA73DRAFT_101371 [Serpula lacrymans var. lacrymans S7.3]
MQMVSTNHVFSAFAFIGFFLSGILLPWHLRVKSLGTCFFIVWTGLLCLNGFVNSVVWDDNTVDWAPVWCDISSRLEVAGRIAIPATSLSIIRRLYFIISIDAVTENAQNKSQRWRLMAVDILLVLGIPLLSIVMAYIIQYQRFSIFEELGCHYSLSNTVISYPLYGIWPVVIGLVTAVYAGIVIHVLIRSKTHVKELLKSDTPDLRYRHSWRLAAIVFAVFLCSFPTSVWYLVEDLTQSTPIPWPGWAVAHASISVITQYSNADWQVSNAVAIYQWERWCYVVYALIFFMLFGFTKEVKEKYWFAIRFVPSLYKKQTGSNAEAIRSVFLYRIPMAS